MPNEHAQHGASDHRAAAPPRHAVQFYERDAFIADAVADYVVAALRAGECALIVATDAHRSAIEQRVAATGVDLAQAEIEQRYLVLDASRTLAQFMEDGRPDEQRFVEVVGRAIGALRPTRRDRDVRVFGEMVALLWAAEQREAAIELERLWNRQIAQWPISLLCAYPIEAFTTPADDAPFSAVCAAHDHVAPAESYLVPADPQERLRTIANLQRKAGMVATQIAERTRSEVARDKALRDLQTIAMENARLYEAERRARAEAEAANRAKDEFLAMLAHELRTPLSAVRSAIVSARLDEKRRPRALDIARRQADRLARLVDDLLDVARITQGRITLHKQRLRFGRIVEHAIDSTRALIEERSHTLNVSLLPSAVIIEADAARLEQVVVNVITNAAKYTDPGGRIDITLQTSGGEAVLTVRDNGLGIAAEVLPTVFDLFVQGDRALDRAPGGLGIGLTVARRLIELHGGSIEARSEGMGKGAEFTIRLPALSAAVEDPADCGDAIAREPSGTRILMVEDNADAAESLMMLLELLGHRVRVVPDGVSALDAARANPPDMMLIDIGLPGMDGYEVARRIRTDPALRKTVLVALTGYGREEDKRQAMDAGFDYHLVKPVDPTALQTLVVELGEGERDPDAIRRLVH